MPRDPHSVSAEPHLGTPARAKDAVDHEVWSEPCRPAGARAADPSKTLCGQLRQQWGRVSWGRSWGVVAALSLVAGPFAILAAFLKTSAPTGLLAALIAAPLVEELGKAVVPLMVLERRPYLFAAGGQLVLVGAFSGLVFAAIENALYLHVFVGDPTASLRAWRWGICTAVHVGCSSIAGLGLRRMWRAARALSSLAGMSLAAPCLIAAMIVHGAYNAAAIALERTGALSFAE